MTMARKPRKDDRPRPVRSADQREWNVAVGLASKLWETLSDEQFRTWNVLAKTRRTSGQRCFVGVNAPRFRDGQEPLMVPPPPATYSGKRILKRFLISNRGGRITLMVVVSRIPGVRITVWASRPCNRGVSGWAKCPRLGDLPAPTGGVCDITWLYFQKHWDYIEKHGVELVGKRIFIQLRVELEGRGKLFEVAQAVVPPPEERRGAAKKG
jgi:hypothetical protein